MAHHLNGETRSTVAGWANGLTFGLANAFADIANNAELRGLRGMPAFSQAYVLGGIGGKAPERVLHPWRANTINFFGRR